MRDLRHDVMHGLARRPRSLSCKFLYDERGSALFEQICELPEYYLTRTERSIMARRVGEMASALGPRCLVIEFGSGSSAKTTLLLDHLHDPVGYVPIDISREALGGAADRLATRYPDLEILPVGGDFHRDVEIPTPRRAARRRVVYFPGSTIGNFAEDEARVFLDRMAGLVGPSGGLLIGIDLRKSKDILLPAYDDAAGVTSEFNLNMLARINRDLGADFRLDQFRHEAIWNDEAGRMEMSLISVRAQTVTIDGARFVFTDGERIGTEHSHKYTLEQFRRIARSYTLDGIWTDPDAWFCVQLLRPRANRVVEFQVEDGGEPGDGS